MRENPTSYTDLARRFLLGSRTPEHSLTVLYYPVHDVILWKTNAQFKCIRQQRRQIRHNPPILVMY